jgi:hypothetical protein
MGFYPFGPVSIVNLPPGLTVINTSKPIPSNAVFQGSGQGVTILRASSSLGGGIFSQVVPSGQSLVNVLFRDLTLDGNTGPGGSNAGIAIDTSALNTTPYYNLIAENVDFINCAAGWQHAGNNASGGPLNNETTCVNCRFFNCGMGGLIGSTYSSKFIDCLFAGCTINAIGTSGYNGSPVLPTAAGPTTNATVRGCHVEGLGNLTGGGTATESGISLNSTLPEVKDCQLNNISRFPVLVEDNEGLGGVVSGIRCWGSGGTVIGVDQGGNGGGFIAISDLGCSEVSQNAGLTTAFGQRGVISVNGGNATISNIAVAPATGFGTEPPYALNLGADGNNKVGIVDVSQFHCSSPTISWLTIQNTQNAMTLKIRNSRGYNPAGSQTVAVPASGTAAATLPVDAMYYITGAAGGSCTIAVSGGPTVTVPASTLVSVLVPAGQAPTPTYGAGNAPTWAVEGN